MKDLRGCIDMLSLHHTKDDMYSLEPRRKLFLPLFSTSGCNFRYDTGRFARNNLQDLLNSRKRDFYTFMIGTFSSLLRSYQPLSIQRLLAPASPSNPRSPRHYSHTGIPHRISLRTPAKLGYLRSLQTETYRIGSMPEERMYADGCAHLSRIIFPNQVEVSRVALVIPNQVKGSRSKMVYLFEAGDGDL